MSRYDHKIETSLEGIEHLSKEKKEKERRKMKEKNHYYLCKRFFFIRNLSTVSKLLEKEFDRYKIQ